ncbi:MAG: DUF924 domain-containing protein [Myxococcales bacterium]|nr:DUF924 domain-containing protein [Myxococcales bacterium]
MSQTTAADILEFWFSERVKPLHWKKDAEFDAEVRERFLPTYEAVCGGERDAWVATPEGALALIIVLDQFARNMFRGDARSFAADGLARWYTNRALQLGLDQFLEPPRRMFMIMPLMHSERLEDQQRCIELLASTDLASNLRFAYLHKDIIARFGRFPHRNAVLGRVSTPDERVFLQNPHAGF